MLLIRWAANVGGSPQGRNSGWGACNLFQYQLNLHFLGVAGAASGKRFPRLRQRTADRLEHACLVDGIRSQPQDLVLPPLIPLAAATLSLSTEWTAVLPSHAQQVEAGLVTQVGTGKTFALFQVDGCMGQVQRYQETGPETQTKHVAVAFAQEGGLDLEFAC